MNDNNIIVQALNHVSTGSFIIWTVAIIVATSAVIKALEKYRKTINTVEIKDIMINQHNKDITEIKNSFNEINTKINTLTDAISSVDESNSKRELRRLRWELLNFAAMLRDGRHPCLDEFKHIFDDSKEYHRLLDVTGVENGYTDIEMQYVTDVYTERFGNNSKKQS